MTVAHPSPGPAGTLDIAQDHRVVRPIMDVGIISGIGAMNALAAGGADVRGYRLVDPGQFQMGIGL